MKQLEKTLLIKWRPANEPGDWHRNAKLSKDGDSRGAKWTWNESLENPTIGGSILTKYKGQVVHFFLRDGKIENCGDGIDVVYCGMEIE